MDAKADTAMGGVWKKGPGPGLFKSLNDVSKPFAAPTPRLPASCCRPASDTNHAHLNCRNTCRELHYMPQDISCKKAVCMHNLCACDLSTRAQWDPAAMGVVVITHLHCALQQLGYVAIIAVTHALCVAATGVCCHDSSHTCTVCCSNWGMFPS